ncbi:hypothetical protein pEaSNUABM34_00036 [Erwinia phage pEa_SNUABM_34]|nr:hypothetical protein pEaSNUABM34_00036 [Erwinia phage pEa_SNUABM_34]QYW05051.1 hypothetical protein pEaSNUABM21_00037 [Erwinia phage pEa_SNUABM_21]
MSSVNQLRDQLTEAEYAELERTTARSIMEQVWALRGWTVKLDWCNYMCDDVDWLFHGNERKAPVDHAMPNSGVGTSIEQHRLNVVFTPTEVSVTNSLVDSPVTGTGMSLRCAYCAWLLAIEKQKAANALQSD